MFDFRAIRVRVIGLIILLAALLGYFAGRIGAQPLEATGPEFILRESGVDNEWYRVGKLYNVRTQACWIMLRGRHDSAPTIAPAPREVCK